MTTLLFDKQINAVIVPMVRDVSESVQYFVWLAI